MTEKTNTVGRKQKYDEATKVISFRIPLTSEIVIKDIVSKYLLKLEK